jgi:hypothetical protein
VSLHVRRDQRGALTIVTALQLFDYFEQLVDEDKQTLYLATFGARALQQQRLAELALREDVVAELDGLPEPYVIGGAVVHDPRVLRVEGPAGDASCAMTYTRNGDHHGYSHTAGFALTISDRQLDNGEWVHKLGALADPDVALELADETELWHFLAACQPGAVLLDDARENWRLGAESFGLLDLFAFFARCRERVATLPGFGPGIAELRDAFDDETQETMEWLAVLAAERERIRLPAFVVGDADESQLETEAGYWRVPAVANTARGSVFAFLQCEGDALLEDGMLRGIRTREILEVEIEVRAERAVKATSHPEIVFERSHLVLALGEQGFVQAEAVEGRGPEEMEWEE